MGDFEEATDREKAAKDGYYGKLLACHTTLY
jgi:hypothetical protein